MIIHVRIGVVSPVLPLLDFLFFLLLGGVFSFSVEVVSSSLEVVSSSSSPFSLFVRVIVPVCCSIDNSTLPPLILICCSPPTGGSHLTSDISEGKITLLLLNLLKAKNKKVPHQRCETILFYYF